MYASEKWNSSRLIQTIYQSIWSAYFCRADRIKLFRISITNKSWFYFYWCENHTKDVMVSDSLIWKAMNFCTKEVSFQKPDDKPLSLESLFPCVYEALNRLRLIIRPLNVLTFPFVAMSGMSCRKLQFVEIKQILYFKEMFIAVWKVWFVFHICLRMGPSNYVHFLAPNYPKNSVLLVNGYTSFYSGKLTFYPTTEHLHPKLWCGMFFSQLLQTREAPLPINQYFLILLSPFVRCPDSGDEFSTQVCSQMFRSIQLKPVALSSFCNLILHSYRACT